MTSFETRINALIKLGNWLDDFCQKTLDPVHQPFLCLVQNQHIYNAWLIEPFIFANLRNWAERLSADSLHAFADRYPSLDQSQLSKTIAVSPQDDVPLSGLHEFVCIILSGHRFRCRNIKHQQDLLWFISCRLVELEPSLADSVIWEEHFDKSVDSYFVHTKPGSEAALKQYFAKKHSLVRDRGASVAVILNSDTKDDFRQIAKDVFINFGQSSYNVRKIYVPRGFVLDPFFESIEDFAYVYQYNRYANNYDYLRSIYLMDSVAFLENGFFVIRESAQVQAPIGSLNYEFYDTLEEVKMLIEKEARIQQVVTNSAEFAHAVKPGEAHVYKLWHYEEGKDLIIFLNS